MQNSEEIRTFAHMNENLQQTKWPANVILADADYIDRVAFDLIVNFERMIGRPIPKADLARWIDCVALDGGMREKTETDTQETMVALIHSKGKKRLDHFVPDDFEQHLNGMAFNDTLGEFTLSAFPVEEMVSLEDFFADALQMICAQPEVRRIMVIPNAEDERVYYKVREVLRSADNEKCITVFAMQPQTGGRFQQEILGYSLMAALGIRSEEIHPQESL